MENVLFTKKFLTESHYDYFVGLDKAWKNFQIVNKQTEKLQKDVKNISQKHTRKEDMLNKR